MTDKLEKYLNKIITADSIKFLSKLPENSVDLIFADPPYNLQLNGELYRTNQTKVDGVDDDWDQFESLRKYDNFTKKWLTESKRVLKEDGSLWTIGSYHNIYRVGKIIQDLGFWILNDIEWIKTNPMPNFKGTRFNNSHETLLWVVQNQNSNYTFNYKSMKMHNDGKQMRSDWYLPICNGKERLKNNGKKVHSTQKPESLLYRIILSTSEKGDIVLDPFMGSGTTAAVAKKLQRNYIGIDKERKYNKFARKRVSKVKPIKEEDVKLNIEKGKPKVSFGKLVEAGLIKAGENLYDKEKKHKAKVLSSGSLKWKDREGSIHQISARILEKQRNNGWAFWYKKQNNKLISIDDLRYKYAKKYHNEEYVKYNL